jgi:hypothetical protein
MDAFVIFFYFVFGEPGSHALSAFLASLLIQLADQSPSCRSLLKAFCIDSRKSPITPSDTELFGCLESMLHALPKIYIVIDALDECPEAIRLAPAGLLFILKKLVDLRIDNIRLFMTSRPVFDIRAQMMSIPRHELNINSSSRHTKNLALFISREISEYRGWTELDKSMVNKNLNLRADGM